MFLTLSKLLAVLATVGGGGVATYYLTTRSSNSGTTQHTQEEKTDKGIDFSKPYELKHEGGGYSSFAESQKDAEDLRRDYYGGKGEIIKRPECISS